MEYTIIVDASGFKSSGYAIRAPYAGCAMGNISADPRQTRPWHLRRLIEHAGAYRSIFVIAQKTAPDAKLSGDVFYLHSRLAGTPPRNCLTR